MESSKSPPEGFVCSCCGEHFSTKQHLNEQVRSHEQEQEQFCSRCNKNFSWKSHLQKDEENHICEERYICDMCSSSLCTKRNIDEPLKKHARFRTERPYTCPECTAQFVGKQGIERHMRKHTGEQPYTCDICGKKFSQKSNLNQHKQIHFREESRGCSTSGQMSVAKSNSNVCFQRFPIRNENVTIAGEDLPENAETGETAVTGAVDRPREHAVIDSSDSVASRFPQENCELNSKKVVGVAKGEPLLHSEQSIAGVACIASPAEVRQYKDRQSSSNIDLFDGSESLHKQSDLNVPSNYLLSLEEGVTGQRTGSSFRQSHYSNRPFCESFKPSGRGRTGASGNLPQGLNIVVRDNFPLRHSTSMHGVEEWKSEVGPSRKSSTAGRDCQLLTYPMSVAEGTSRESSPLPATSYTVKLSCVRCDMEFDTEETYFDHIEHH